MFNSVHSVLTDSSPKDNQADRAEYMILVHAKSPDLARVQNHHQLQDAFPRSNPFGEGNACVELLSPDHQGFWFCPADLDNVEAEAQIAKSLGQEPSAEIQVYVLQPNLCCARAESNPSRVFDLNSSAQKTANQADWLFQNQAASVLGQPQEEEQFWMSAEESYMDDLLHDPIWPHSHPDES